jgi:hypothetical protein
MEIRITQQIIPVLCVHAPEAVVFFSEESFVSPVELHGSFTFRRSC